MGNKITRTIDKKTLDIFVKLTRKTAKKEIQKREEKYDRKLTKEEKSNVIKRVARRTRGRVALVSMFALVSFTGMQSKNLLNERNYRGIYNNQEEVSTDAEEIDNKKISINNVSDNRELFINGLKVETSEIEESKNMEQENTNTKVYSSNNLIKQEELENNNFDDIKENIEEEINNLDTSDEILEYIKNLYVNEYNSLNNANITANDIRFEQIQRGVLYHDKAENGDDIVRNCQESEYEGIGIPVQTDLKMVNCIIQNDGFIEKQSVTNNYGSGEYVSVYSKDEKVEKADVTPLNKLGGVIDNGIDYYSAIKNNNTQELNIYKGRFINSLVEYKQSEINNSLVNNEQINETSEELEQ